MLGWHKAQRLQPGVRLRGLTALACILMLPLVAGHAAARDPAAGLPIAPILACQEDHFDPERYRADLVDAGWQIAPSEMRSDIALRLADAFEPLAEPPAEDADVTALRNANRAEWLRLTQDRVLLTRPGAVLFIAGLTANDGQRAIECWVSLTEGDLVEGLLEAALAGRGEVEADTVGVVEYGPFPLPDGGAFALIAVRRPPAAPDDPAGAPALTARHGMMTRTVLPPSE